MIYLTQAIYIDYNYFYQIYLAQAYWKHFRGRGMPCNIVAKVCTLVLTGPNMKHLEIAISLVKNT